MTNHHRQKQNQNQMTDEYDQNWLPMVNQFYWLNYNLQQRFMINQLVASSQRQRLKNKKMIESRFVKENSRKKIRQTLVSTDSQDHSNDLESDLPVSLITPVRRGHKQKREEVSMWDIETSVRSRLKQKEIFLPQIDYSPSYSRSIPRDPPALKSHPKKHTKEIIFKSRLKTCGNEPIITEIEDQRYDETIVEINQLNDRFNRQIRRKKHDRRMYYDTRDIYGEGTVLRRNKFNHISRQEQFQQYVDYLENMYNRKRDKRRQSEANREQIEQKLRSRVETKHHNQSRNKVDQDLVMNPVQTQEKQRENPETSTSEKVRKEAHDNFIKILRKAKNRGESLLIKLSKYPSQKLMK